MVPLFLPGERVVVDVWAYRFNRPMHGQVVVVRHPHDRSLLLFKRVGRMMRPDMYEIVSDNPEDGIDSRHFGPIHRRDIIGKYIFTYHRP